MKSIGSTIALILSITFLAQAAERMSDAEVKQKLLGYWSSPPHGYEYKSDGLIQMLGGTTTNRWDVHNGVYYEDSDPFDIVALTSNKFVRRDRGHDRLTYILQRISKEEAARY